MNKNVKKRKTIVIVIICCVLVALFIRLKNNMLKASLVEFSSPRGESWKYLEYNGITYQAADFEVPLISLENRGKQFGFYIDEEYDVETEIYEVTNENRDEWIYAVLDVFMTSGETFYRANTEEKLTWENFGIDRISIRNIRKRNKVVEEITDRAVIDDLMEKMKNTEYLDVGHESQYWDVEHEYSFSCRVLFLSSDHPGLALEYFLDYENEKRYLSSATDSKMQDIGDILTPYVL